MIPGYLVETITSDGLELKGFWVDTKSDVAVLHSHGTAGDFYTHKFVEVEAQRLSKMGVSFLTANNRGHDVYADIRKHVNGKVEWTQIGGGFEKFEECVLDIAAWLDFLTAHGVKRVILQGHSLSQKSLYYQHIKHDSRVIGQIHLSPQNDAGVMNSILGDARYKEVNAMIAQKLKEGKTRELLQPELSAVCAMAVQGYSGYLTEEGTGNLSPYHNPSSSKWKILETTVDPILVVFGSTDVYMKPSVADAAKLWKEKATSAKSITVDLVEGAPHSYVGFEKPLVDILQRWIQKLV